MEGAPRHLAAAICMAVGAFVAASVGVVTAAGPASVTTVPPATIPVGRGMFVLERPTPMIGPGRGPDPAPAVLKVAADGSTTDLTPAGLVDPAYITASRAGDLFVADMAQSSVAVA